MLFKTFDVDDLAVKLACLQRSSDVLIDDVLKAKEKALQVFESAKQFKVLKEGLEIL